MIIFRRESSVRYGERMMGRGKLVSMVQEQVISGTRDNIKTAN